MVKQIMQVTCKKDKTDGKTKPSLEFYPSSVGSVDDTFDFFRPIREGKPLYK